MKIWTAAFFLWTALLHPYPDAVSFSENLNIRVAVLQNSENFTLTIPGGYILLDPETDQEIQRGRRLKKTPVHFQSEGMQIGTDFYSFQRLRILAKKEFILDAAGKEHRYRGMLEIVRQKNNQLLVINILDVETYVKGVLYHEVTDQWPLEALKAQAVAARTYALYQIEAGSAKPFDVTSDVYSQVYGGRSAERYRTNLAVNRTRGEILVSEGKVLPAYYHSNCGGHTEDARELWGQNVPALHGVPCLFCRTAPHAHWKKNFRSRDVQAQLNQAGYPIGVIKEIQVDGRSASGRVTSLKITARDGRSIRVPGKKFREVIGPNLIKSSMYDIEMQGYYFDVIGSGWGHGVGMCQWGAHEMAKQRFRYRHILNYYYPGAEIKEYESVISSK